MRVTHRVKDSAGDTVGFIIDGTFYTDYYAKEIIEYIDNMSLSEDGTFQAKNTFSEAEYKKAVRKQKYDYYETNNPLQRDIQDELLKWKNNRLHKVLQLEGTRQIGKTAELKKFAYKNYEYVIYVDLSDDTSDFSDAVNHGGSPAELEKYCRRAKLPHFVNNGNTILIIDEIQNSSKVYNAIRRLHEKLQCDIIVTGSYLGRIIGKNDFFLPAGTISYLYMFPLSFREFCRAFDCEEALDKIDLFGSSDSGEYHKLEQLYRIYLQIGGYPEVITTFKATESIDSCYNVISKLLHTFKDESRVYFNEPREVEIFENVYREALKEMCSRDDMSGKHILETLTAFAKDKTKLFVNRNEVANAVIWLEYAGIMSMCNLAIDGDMRNIAESRKAYFSDCGIVSYLASNSMIDQSSLNGVITETFVYNELHRLFKVPYTERKVIEEEVCFSTYGDNELDFMVADKNKIIYGIEVKTKDGEPKSLKIFIDKRLANKGVVVKPTKGGHGDKFDTIPIYTVGCRFPYYG